MSSQRAFALKIAYIVAIGLLLIPLFLLARPSSADRTGGKLSQLRAAEGLSEAELGEIDPASEAMKLSTFGMRGVATAVLWLKSNDYKKKKDWTNFAAALNQIIRLEPHFASVWQHQAWNIAYNVSVEFDDYRERYRWVIKGIEFLIRGVDYNKKNPRLYSDVGWDIAQKIGTADEKVQFRKLFVADDEFHNKYRTPTYEDRDNWLVGKSWYTKAEQLHRQGESIGNMGENIFYARRPMCQMNYARNIESDGAHFGERAKQDWEKAHREWTTEFGAMPIRTTYRKDDDSGVIEIVLNDYEGLSTEIDRYAEELSAIQPGLHEELFLKRWAKLDPQDKNAWRYLTSKNVSALGAESVAKLLDQHEPGWRSTDIELVRPLITSQQAAALAKPQALRSVRESELAEQASTTIGEAAYRANDALKVNMEDLARQMEGENRRKAFQLVQKAATLEKQRGIIGNYRQTVNYEEWKFRAWYEQLPEALGAREYVFKGRQALKDALLPEAADHFRRGLEDWGKLLAREDCRRLADDRDTIDDLKEVIGSYVSLLNQRDELFPEDFPLADFYGRLAASDPGGGVATAREAADFADSTLAGGDPEKAAEAYQSALNSWNRALQDFPALALMINRNIGNEMVATLEGYSAALAKVGKRLPPDFLLAEFLGLQLTHAPETVEARRQQRLAAEQLRNSVYPAAEELLEKAIAAWRGLIDRFPSVSNGGDPAIAAEIAETINLYRKVLELRGKEFPKDFKLQDFVGKQQKQA